MNSKLRIPLCWKVARYEPGHIAIDLSAPAADGSVLVLSENYFPGWTATSGGKALPTSRANFNLIGVGLAAGVQHVDISFEDPAYDRGRLVTLLGLAIGIVGLIAGLVVDRRRPAAAIPA